MTWKTVLGKIRVSPEIRVISEIRGNKYARGGRTFW
jgi:hypothetical protein